MISKKCINLKLLPVHSFKIVRHCSRSLRSAPALATQRAVISPLIDDIITIASLFSTANFVSIASFLSLLGWQFGLLLLSRIIRFLPVQCLVFYNSDVF